MDEYIEKPDVQYILHIKSDKKVEKRLIDYCLESVVYVFEDTGLTADVQPMSQWISVEDRLPKEQQCILAYEKDYGVMWGDYQGIKYSQPVWIVRKQGLIIRTTEVTHWMPLPEPPKEGDING